MSSEVFITRKVKVKISGFDADSEILQFNDHECTLITTVRVDEFVKLILARRFGQIATLIYTDSRNILNKLIKYELLNSIDFHEWLTIPNTVAYIWETNGGSKVFIIPPLHVMFMTKSNNCYILEYPIHQLLADYIGG